MRLYHFLLPIAVATLVSTCLGESLTGTVTIVNPAEPTANERPVLGHGEPKKGPTEAFIHHDSTTVGIEDSRPVARVRRVPSEVTKSLEYRCGEKFGRCPSGTCCSSVGFCGTTKAHCRSPDCQIDFGKCDAHKTPKGPPTKEILRPHVGQVPYGPVEVRSCAVPGTVALTFDDGPTRYTNDLLDLLDKYEAPSTFFVTGNNNGKGEIDDPDLPWAALIERMLLSGHQVASHTWSHEDLSKITAVQRADQIEKNEAALRNVMGSFPTYIRPPYSSCVKDSGCREHLGKMGYHIILYDIDTDDYKNDHPNLIQRSKDIFDQALSSASPASKSWLIIAHDAHEQTVHNLTEHMLKTMARLGYRPSTVGDCLKDPRELWYRKDSRWPGHRRKKGPKKETAMQVSVDGSCGKNYTCLGSSFGLCCGNWNMCGNSTNHCGPGCQKAAGYCTIEAPPNGDAWDPKFPHKSGKSEADSDYRSVRTAAATSLFLAMMVAVWM